MKLKGNILYTIANFYSTVIAFLFLIPIRNVISEEIIGMFVFTNSVIIAFDIPRKLVSFSIERLLPKYLLQRSEEEVAKFSNAVFSFLLMVNLVSSLLFVAFGQLFFSNPQSLTFISVAFVFGFDAVVSFLFFYAKSHNELKTAAIVLFIKATLFNVTVFTTALLFGDEGYYYGLPVGSFLSLIISYLFLKLKSNVKLPSFGLGHIKLKELKEIWGVGLSLCIAGILSNLLFATDKYYLKYVIESVESGLKDDTLAYYGLAVQGIMASSIITKSFAGSFSPKLYQSADAKESSKELVNKISVLNLLVSVVFAASIFLLIDILIPIAFPMKPNWVNTIPYFKILCISIIPLSQFNVAYILSVAKNKYIFLNVVYVVMLLVAVILNHLGYINWGVNGVPYASVVTVGLIYLTISFTVRSEFPLWFLGALITLIFMAAMYLGKIPVAVLLVLSLVSFVVLKKRGKLF